ncbi:unnamed protein product [Callosobruchus maculatus]|uniref:Uncharacterized protein n=1 Tax=Callosobruchus maculatus TaxID=64391 RepID=A0A653CCI1_CALMS|nr:unnamed protein product [Callosobruchus maculatus]
MDKLAGSKADNWWLRQHPKVIGMKFKKGVKRAEISNAIDNFVSGTVGKDMDRSFFESLYDEVPIEFSENEISTWLSKLSGVALGSDAFFPFRDNVERARLYHTLAPHLDRQMMLLSSKLVMNTT